MKREQEIILKILKYENDESLIEMFADKSINWINVLGYLTYHRIAGLTYEKISNINVRLLDYPVFFTTYMINESQKMRTLEQTKWINKISKIFQQRNIKYAFLKGAVLNSTLFSIGSRASNDIDILINKADINKATKALKELGFLQGKFDYKNNEINEFSQEELDNSIKTKGETAPFIMISQNPTIKTVDVDLNFSLDWSPTSENNSVDYFLNNRILINTFNKEPIYSLNYNHTLIELCVHLYKDSCLIDIIKKRKVLDLYKFVDIYYYIMKYNNLIDFEKLYEDIKVFKLEKYIFFALFYIINIFPDSHNENIDWLLKKINVNAEETMNTIFDQYNINTKMYSHTTFLDRLFVYNLINEYRGEIND